MANAMTKENLLKALQEYHAKIGPYLTTIDETNLKGIIGFESRCNYSKMLANQTPVVGEYVQFNTVLDKGVTVINGQFTAVKGTTYRLKASVYCSTTSGYVGFCFYNVTKGIEISTRQYTMSDNYSSPSSGDNNIELLYEATDNDVISVKIIECATTTIASAYSYLIIEERERNYIIDPMNVKDVHVVKRGEFSMSAGQTTGLTNGAAVLFDTVDNGNIELNVSTHGIKLEANTEYKIEVDILLINDATGYSTLSFKDFTSGQLIGKTIDAVSVTHTAAYNGQGHLSVNYTSSVDCEVGLVLVSSHATTIYNAYTKLSAMEIAQPVVVEYNKYNELSNPLTTKPLEYGEFGVSAAVSNLAAGTHLTLDTIISGNMSLANGGVLLKAGVTYEFGINLLLTVGTSSGLNIQLCNAQTNEVLKFLYRAAPVSNAGNSISNLSSVLYTPSSDIYVSILSSDQTITISNTQYFSFIVREYRNTSVNQYGGFEKKVLFDGNANAVGTYTLTDTVQNYDFIVIEGYSVNASFTKQDKNPLIIPVESIDYNFGYEFIYDRYYSSTIYFYINFHFTNETSLYIDAVAHGTAYTNVCLSKVIGYKGQLPTLLQGGEF